MRLAGRLNLRLWLVSESRFIVPRLFHTIRLHSRSSFTPLSLSLSLSEGEMARKPRRNVPEILWRSFGERAKNLKDSIIDLITPRSIQPEKCRCRGQGCLGCSGDKASFLLRPDDPIHYRKLLHRCFVVLHEQAPPPPRFSPTSWGSQRDVRFCVSLYCVLLFSS